MGKGALKLFCVCNTQGCGAPTELLSPKIVVELIRDTTVHEPSFSSSASLQKRKQRLKTLLFHTRNSVLLYSLLNINHCVHKAHVNWLIS
jgi:hypothetical protein